jgi:acid phosphatase type 7
MRTTVCCALIAFLLPLAGCKTTGEGSLGDSVDAAQGLDRTSGVEAKAPVDAGRGEAEPPETVAIETVEVRPAVCENKSYARELGDSADTTFDLGPYVMNVHPDSIVVMWRTLEDASGTVHYGVEEPVEIASQTDLSSVHEITLTGLAPDTRYAYRVESDGVSSGVLHFQTAVPAGQGFRFVAWGDNQSGPTIFSQLLPSMLAEGPHLAVGVGDHVQEGNVSELWKDQLFEPARVLFHQVPFYAALGNHEQNAAEFWDLFAYPHPLEFNEPGAYYSYSYGNAFFVVINTNTAFFPIGETDTPASAWLKEQLASQEAQDATWRFAYAHEPAISESWGAGNCKYDGNLAIQNLVLPLLAEHKFHFYFAGHTHAYERAMLDGVIQVITGGGGGGLDEWCVDFPETTVVYQNHHFLRVDAGCDTLRLEAIDLDGKVFDWVELAADEYGVLQDQGPAPDLPELIINEDAPTP